MKPTRDSYFHHHRRQSSSSSSNNNNNIHHLPPSPSVIPTTTAIKGNKLRGIHINISSDPFQHRIPALYQLWQDSPWKQYTSKLRRKYSAKMVILGLVVLVFICIILLRHVGFFSGKKYQDWERHDHRHGFDEHADDYLDEVDLLEHMVPEAGKGLTALIIVLPQNNNNDLKDVLSSLCDYDMFGQVLIWNNDPQQQQQVDLLQRQCNKITIHHSPIDLKSTARYMACTMAKTPYCYFQGNHNKTHLRAIYANFLRSPSLIHGESTTLDHYTASQWTHCFWYEPVGLNACYLSPMGMFVTKDMAATFLHQMELDPVDPEYADMYFTLWMNQGGSYLLQGNNDEEEEESQRLTTQEMDHLQHGLRTLYNSLKHRNGIFTEQQQQDEGRVREELEARNAKAVCADGRCLFLTNVQSLPSLDLFSHQPMTMHVQDAIRLHQDYYSGQGSLLANHTYLYAVDGRDDTAWMSPEYIQKGDSIGLDLLIPVRIPLRYRILVDHPYSYHRAIQLEMSFDGSLWMTIRPPQMTCFSLDQRNIGSLLECKFTISETGYRFIRLVARHDLDYRFMVYDLSFSARVKRDKNGQFLENAADDRMAFVED
ncbi:uncharacterized protein BX664DRAFT_358190 [Halteromyces radiatus]|uniref:uncharacterized protein n=1 Tax=Halteromyces radiatus TaxID=101107 RepID=UPI00221E5540|nr:uncharacterized protein BX664DRAFT_358190 [Halteromyces radiatus]KAI8093802.1 hypothetical protein BX664DRAFT_358190 [Halteromyces radiatus]